MTRTQCTWSFPVLCVLSGLAAGRASAQPTPPPSAQKILELARAARFEARAAPDEPLPEQALRLSPGFRLEVYRRAGNVPRVRSSEGAVLARVAIRGVPEERGLPAGEYYLWFGGTAEAPRAALARLDGAVVKALDVLSRPLAQMIGPDGRSLRWEVEVQPPEAGRAPGPRSEMGPPPKRLWKQICVTPATRAPRSGPLLQHCARVPAS